MRIGTSNPVEAVPGPFFIFPRTGSWTPAAGNRGLPFIRMGGDGESYNDTAGIYLRSGTSTFSEQSIVNRDLRFAFATSASAGITNATVNTGWRAATTARTFSTNAAADTIAPASHYWSLAGTVMKLVSTGTLPAGLAIDTWYYKIGTATAGAGFQVETSIGGGAVDITDTGSGTHTAIPYAPLALPATAAVDDEIWINTNDGAIRVTQAASQLIRSGETFTTVGTTGELRIDRYSAVRLRCVVANTTWIIVHSAGTYEMF
jgi:hypothetical protein